MVEVNNCQFVHLRVKFPEMLDWVHFTGVHGNPQVSTRRVLWDELGGIARLITCHWLIAGDLNAFLRNGEKKGGARHGKGACQDFNKFVNDYSLNEIYFQGSKFIWNRGSIFLAS